MGKPDPPPAPNYAAAAQAQGQANVDAARVQGKINNPNVVNPYGTQTTTWGTFDQPGFDKATQQYKQTLAAYNQQLATTSPFLKSTLKAPIAPTRDQYTANGDTPTLTQTFSPEQQALYNQSTKNQQGLGMLGQQGIQSAQGIIGNKVDYSGAPAMPGSYDALRSKVYDAMMARPNQDIAVQRDNTNSNLIAAGIRPGTTAYDNAMRNVDRQQTDAEQQAQINAGNQTQQAYGMDLQSRQQGLNEYNAQRSIPLNEITALMSGSQVSNPFSMPGYAQNAQVAPAPVYAAANAQNQYGVDLYNQKAAQQANLQSGLFGLGGAGIMGGAMMASDRRLKSRIRRIGTHPLGIGLYEYTIAGRRERGVMADEVLTVRPQAVHVMPDGYFAVNYGGLS